MSISPSQAPDSSLSYLLQQQTQPKSDQSLDSQLQILTKAINTGDLNRVQSTYENLKTSLPDNASNGDDPVGQFLAAVANGLESSDLSSLQNAADAFTVTPPTTSSKPSASPLLSEDSGSELTNLLKALESNNTGDAQSSYDSLVNTLNENGSSESTSLADALSQVGDALQNGDTALASSRLQQTLQDLSPGSLIVAEA
ncbi:hypothetical protein [Gynuella sunshinyii]|uniref:Uncharacterized protein n=1 Tax=Gynuella sunshinyii YC6258 TaxID=1445510 RepID=A0A0C5W2X8_9GAMM|nr:hypothetical protein [Gynuella sunshinyii]AJQ97024.1 hypothetical Protein YC6258_04991 [Gynuella sunshinyii YC6258]